MAELQSNRENRVEQRRRRGSFISKQKAAKSLINAITIIISEKKKSKHGIGISNEREK